jgi:hypothetical protein
MKPHPNSLGALPRRVAASLLLSLLPLTGQTLVNGNFDAQPSFGTFPGYASGNGGSITGWTLSPDTRVGLNTSSGPFANNGTIPSPPNAAFIQAGGSGAASISQTVTDLVIGTKYTVTAKVTARATSPTANVPSIVFSTDVPGYDPVKLEITQTGGTNPYKNVSFQFTASETSHLITFTNDRTTGDHTLVLDDVAITASSTASSWDFSAWTGDADSGIDPQYVYTHAVNFASFPPATINGVNFIGREGGTPGRFQLTDLNEGFGNRTPNNVTGDSANLAKDFRYNGANTGITLQNLKPSTQYVFTAYGLAFDAAGVYRSSTFGSDIPGSDKFSVNLNHYGQGNGIKVTYTYTTDALGTPVAISYPTHGAGSWHTSGFSNREAVASTPPVQWAVEAWNDDASSGVSPNHVYTHAFNFGTAANFNLNGINFTGLAGANPVGTDFTSANLPSVFNNDTNNVSGYGSPLARDFIYNGFPAVYNLSGLTPGKDYVFTLYSVGWDDGARPGAFIGGVGEQMTVLNQDEFGDNIGVRFEYTYTADASGTAKITVGGFDGGKSIHTYGMSNREADPMIGVAPSITLQPASTTVGTGTSVVLRVGAVGSETLSYQWKRGTTDVGTDSPLLELGEVDFTDVGAYTVVVTNGVDSVTSDPADLVVLDNVPGVFGTGLGSDGQPLPAGAADPHYTLIVNPDNTESSVALVQGNLPGAWLPNSATSKWIGPRTDTSGAAALVSDDGEGFGNYVYRTQIDLTGFDLSTVKIQGSWASDNTGLAIRVNGAATGIDNLVGVTFGALTPFVIDVVNAPGLVNGINTIDFVVNNADVATGFTGLRIDNLRAIGLIPPNTPPHIAVQPLGGNGPHNGTFTLAVGASGSAPLEYQWFKGEEELDGETGPTLVLDIFDTTPAGDYTVVVSNGVAPDAESNVATVTVTNAIPVVVDDNLVTDEDTPLVIDPGFDLLPNDTDADGDSLTLGTFAATSFNGGTVTEEGGLLTYTPAPGFSGLDGFTYTVTDGWGGTSALGTVLITVNDVPEPAPGPMTLDVDLVGGNVTGTFTGAPGATYILQRSTTLGNDWVNVDTEIAPPSGIVIVEDVAPPAGRAFYRISYTP